MRPETHCRALGVIALPALSILFALRPVGAHCDTRDGPVMTAARAALEKGVLTPVLGWMRAEHEPEVKGTFQRARARASSGRRRAAR